jgi:hypothetical protein
LHFFLLQQFGHAGYPKAFLEILALRRFQTCLSSVTAVRPGFPKAFLELLVLRRYMICLSSFISARTGFPRAFLEFQLLGKILDAYFCFSC